MIYFILGILIGSAFNKQSVSSAVYASSDIQGIVVAVVLGFGFLVTIIYNICRLLKEIKEENQRKKITNISLKKEIKDT